MLRKKSKLAFNHNLNLKNMLTHECGRKYFWNIIGQKSSVSRSNWIHVVIFRIFFTTFEMYSTDFSKTIVNFPEIQPVVSQIQLVHLQLAVGLPIHCCVFRGLKWTIHPQWMSLNRRHLAPHFIRWYPGGGGGVPDTRPDALAGLRRSRKLVGQAE